MALYPVGGCEIEHHCFGQSTRVRVVDVFDACRLFELGIFQPQLQLPVFSVEPLRVGEQSHQVRRRQCLVFGLL